MLVSTPPAPDTRATSRMSAAHVLEALHTTNIDVDFAMRCPSLTSSPAIRSALDGNKGNDGAIYICNETSGATHLVVDGSGYVAAN